MMCAELLQVLFRTDNKFDSEEFASQKYGAIQATLETCPREAVSCVALRIQDSEASIGEKLFLFETLGNAAQALADLESSE